ncbi:MAG: hypothetical protein F6K22_15860 [Okeania sp. SIO2F4]|uniref:hypothetical protein n=1 Tax=Okeania sp. SIO2F4 TaxID=2607790 RepID=UPI00142C723F|nr:hypothetical protein [Okeania sp. SIO2F4]NES04179.1 hypothetical protein [Okeania sp. SIO2F4]
MQYQQINVTNLLDKTFATFRVIYLPLLIIGLPAVILFVLLYFLPESSTQYYWLYWFLVVLINPWLFAIRYLYIYKYLRGIRISLVQAFRRGFKKFISLAILSLITLDPLILIKDKLRSNIGLSILFYISLIYFATRIGFYEQMVLIEGTSPFRAITRSWQLTKGYFWVIIRANLIFFVVFCFPMFLFDTILESILNLIPITSALRQDILSDIIRYFAGPTLSSIFSVLLYMELKKIKRIDISKT